MSRVIIHNKDGKLKTEGSFPQTQCSLHDQLKEVRHTAIAIGCYDAADFIMTKIEKIEKSASKGVYTPDISPMCWKCSNKEVQTDMIDERCHEIVGCKLIKQKQWDKDGNEACPLKKENNE